MKIELSYNVMKGTEYFVSLQMNIFITEEYYVTGNSEASQNIWRYRQGFALIFVVISGLHSIFTCDVIAGSFIVTKGRCAMSTYIFHGYMKPLRYIDFLDFNKK